MDLTPQLIVQVQDEVHVSLTDGPLPSRPGPPPLLILVPVLVQNGLELCGVGEDHGQNSLGQTQKQACHSDPARERKGAFHDGDDTAAERRILFVVCKTECMFIQTVQLLICDIAAHLIIRSLFGPSI